MKTRKGGDTVSSGRGGNSNKKTKRNCKPRQNTTPTASNTKRRAASASKAKQTHFASLSDDSSDSEYEEEEDYVYGASPADSDTGEDLAHIDPDVAKDFYIKEYPASNRAFSPKR